MNLRHELQSATYYNNYARAKDDGTPENWEESVDRVMQMHRKKYADKMNDDLREAFAKVEKAYKSKLFVGSQRALQFGGDPVFKHNSRLFNCGASYCDRPTFFGEAFYLLLCGTGVGLSVQKHHIDKLPKIEKPTGETIVHQISDDIEGWAKSVDVLLSSYFEDGGKHPEYKGKKIEFDASLIRPKGAHISGGFKAPGPKPLINALVKIRKLLNAIQNRKLTAIECYDIVMFISDAVLSGGVRRAAVIVLFSFDDEEMLTAKTGNWYEVNPQRARSNNTAMILRGTLTFEQFQKIMHSVKEFGEPGFCFTDNLEALYNPCHEAALYGYYTHEDGTVESSFQFCNLTEGNGAMCIDKQSFLEMCEASAIMGTLQAGYTNFKFLGKGSQLNTERESLLGCSITGWMNNPEILLDKNLLKEGAELIKSVNKYIAALIGINPAARTTCVKPAGNSSALLGTASNTGGEHAKRYIRNAQYTKNSNVAKQITKDNPTMVENSVWSANDSDIVVSYPIEVEGKSIYKNDMLGVKHLDIVKFIQKHWVENGKDKDLCVQPWLSHNVSNTISVDNWDAVTEYLFNNQNSFSGVAFLGLTGDKDYAQAPFVEVLTEDEFQQKYGESFNEFLVRQGLFLDDHDRINSKNWFNLSSKEKDAFWLNKWNEIQETYKPIQWHKIKNMKDIDIDTLGAVACSGGACEI